MAMPTASPSPVTSAQVVGNAFVDQYYYILCQSPELLHQFYQDSSVLSRPGPNGVMTLVTTVQAINEMILSLNYKDYKAEIQTLDAQDSYKDGVSVLVTGCLAGIDNLRKKFTQSFFLAPQDIGYFVLNDIFRYMDENEALETDAILINGTGEGILTAPTTPNHELCHDSNPLVPDSAISLPEETLDNNGEVYEPSDNEGGSVIEDEVVVEPPVHSSQNEVHQIAEPIPSFPEVVVEAPVHSSQNEVCQIAEPVPTFPEVVVEPPVHSSQNEVCQIAEPVPSFPEDAPKKSYASIVKVMKGNMAPSSFNLPTTTVKVASTTTNQQSFGITPPEASPPSGNNAPESSSIHEEVEGHSIYIRSLPMNVTVEQVEEEFKKFGPIKTGGVQVRSIKQQGFCFGFVEFELLSSMQNAIQASPVTIGSRQVFVEEKRTTSRVGGGRGRFPSGRGGFRNDNLRGRGNFGGGRGYGRNEFGNRGELSARRGPSGRSGEGYQRVYQTANGRVGRQGVMNPTTVSA